MAWMSPWETHQREWVESALERYKADINSPAGHDILRYAEKGVIHIDRSVDPNVFIDWYPRHQGYILLRLASQGLLSYRATE